MRTVMKPLFLLATVLLATVAVAQIEEGRVQKKEPGQLSKPPSGSVVRPTPGRKIGRVPFSKGGAPVAVAGQCPAECGDPVKKTVKLVEGISCSGPPACAAAGAGCSCNLWSAPKKTTDWKKVAKQNETIPVVGETWYRCWCTK